MLPGLPGGRFRFFRADWPGGVVFACFADPPDFPADDRCPDAMPRAIADRSGPLEPVVRLDVIVSGFAFPGFWPDWLPRGVGFFLAAIVYVFVFA